MLRDWTLKRINWSLRKVRLPIGSQDLVLDVGSGGNPHPAADVLLDRYLHSKHHGEYALVVDRPSVLGDACKMPFKDKAFDFVIAFHVLEHVNDPSAFLSELQRVGKAGYIETPNALFERLIPYDVHLLEVVNIDDTLVIHKKKSATPDAFLNGLDLVRKSQRWNKIFYGDPELFHTRYLWTDKINWKVLNPEVSSDWFEEPPVTEEENEVAITEAPKLLRSKGLSLVRNWYKFRKKRVIDFSTLLVCPNCHNALTNNEDNLDCLHCRLRYQGKPLPDFNRAVPMENVA